MNNYYPRYASIPIAVYFIIAIVSCCKEMSAQPVIEWDRTYGGNIWEELNSIIITEDDGYFMGGFTSSNSGEEVSEDNYGKGDFWVLKADHLGNKIWDKRYGGDSLDRIWEVLLIPEKGYLLAGESYSPPSDTKSAPAYGKQDFWVVMTDLDGNYLWDRSYGGTQNDWLLSAAPAPNGGCLLGGWSDSGPHAPGNKTAPHKGAIDIWLVMIDADGNVIWDKSFGGNQMEQLHHIQLLADGNYILAGSSASGVCPDKSQPCFGSLDYWIIKINPQGEVIWEKSFGGTEEDVAIIIKEASNGDLYVGGGSKSGINGTKTSSNLGDADYWMLKLNAAGEELYQKRFGGGSLDKIYAIDVTKNDYIIIGGISGSDSNDAGLKSEATHGSWDMWIMYLDPSGAFIWDKVVGGTNQDALTDIVRVRDGSFALVGNSASDIGFEKSEDSRGMNDFWLVKTFCDAPIQINGDSTGCQFEEITLDITIDSCYYCTYLWGNGSREPSITLIPDENFSMKAYVVDRRGCERVDTFYVTIFEKPKAADFELIPPACSGDSNGRLSLLEVTGGTPPYLYSFEGGDFAETLDIDQIAGGEYAVAIQDFWGCRFDTLVTLSDPELFYIDLGPDTVIFLGDSIQILPVANFPVADYIWNTPDFINMTPWIQPQSQVNYQMTAWNEFGCEAQDQRNIFVKIEKNFFAPNIFSPNGDGNNDVFTIFYGKNTVAIRNLKVFDRWGTQVFFAEEIVPGNELAAGWDGSLRSRPMENGTYIYFAEIEFTDGSNIVYKGDVSIVR